MTIQQNSRLYRFLLGTFMIVTTTIVQAQAQNTFTKAELFKKIEQYKVMVKDSIEDKLAPLPQDLVIKSFVDIQSYLPSSFDKQKLIQAGIDLATYINQYNALHPKETFDMLRENELKIQLDQANKLPCFRNLVKEYYDTIHDLVTCCKSTESTYSECSISAAVSTALGSFNFRNCMKRYDY